MHMSVEKELSILLAMIERLPIRPEPVDIGRIQGQAKIVAINLDIYGKDYRDLIVELPDGYNGSTAHFWSTPIARDGGLVKLQCAEKGKEYMTRWAVDADVVAAMDKARQGR